MISLQIQHYLSILQPKTYDMKYIEFEYNDLERLFTKHINLYCINDAIRDAYKIIFDKTYGILTQEDLNTLNKMIKSCFSLLDTLQRYDKQTEPEFDIIRMVRIAITQWFYKKQKTKRIRTKLKKQTYLWQIPKTDETNLRRKFKNEFSGMPEQILASSFFYLLPVLIKSIEQKDLWTYGLIIAAISETNILIQKNAKNIAGGKIIHTTEKKLQKTEKQLLKEFPNIAKKTFEEQILYCTEHFHITENEATDLLHRIENSTSKK